MSEFEKAMGEKPAAPPPESKAKAARRRAAKGSRPEGWMVAVVEQAFKTGGTPASVAALLGVSRARFMGWLDEAAEEGCEDQLLLDLLDATRRGRSDVLEQLQDLALMHAIKDPKTCLDLLRIFNPEYNVSSKVDKQITVTETKTLKVENLTLDELKLMQALERKALGQ